LHGRRTADEVLVLFLWPAGGGRGPLLGRGHLRSMQLNLLKKGRK
jgi:hypothetical protein